MKRFEITELPPYLILYIKVSLYMPLQHGYILDYLLTFLLISEIHEKYIFCRKKSNNCEFPC